MSQSVCALHVSSPCNLPANYKCNGCGNNYCWEIIQECQMEINDYDEIVIGCCPMVKMKNRPNEIKEFPNALCNLQI